MKVLGISLVALSMSGCFMNFGSGTPGSGKLVTVDRVQTGFTKVQNNCAAEVTVSAGKAFSIKITTDSNLEKHVIAKSEGGVLVLKTDESINPTKLVIAITMPKIEGFEINGAGNADVTGIEGANFAGQIDGAGDLTLHGSARDVVLGIDGAGTIKAFELSCDSARASIDGAGDINVGPSKSLVASIDGAGSIRYKGDPKVTESIDGAGSVGKG